jgi:hypothetical protein
MGTELIVGASILGGIVVFVAIFSLCMVVVRRVLKGMGSALERRIARAYPPDRIVLKDLGALTLGLESRGVFQARGNGALVLTPDEVGWFQYIPERNSLRIPRASIARVDTVKSHLGKTYGRDLLRVTFTNNGQPDSMAWVVTDLDAWLARLGEPAGTAP